MQKLLTALTLSLILPLNAAAQMTIPTSFSVTDNGAARYDIPIQVPQGISGIEPKLSLSYSSEPGNLIAGVGWTVTGFSVITRCHQTLHQDGRVAAVTYSASDRYCLDGRRLIAKSGTDGAPGTEYRLERENFSRVVSFGTTGVTPQTGPTSFTVKTKEGLTLEYGGTSDSRIEAGAASVVRVWALSKVSDRKGNYLTISYTKDTSGATYYPLQLSYTGNSNTGLAPANAVIFEYESRPDPTFASQGGTWVRNGMRLKQIRTTTANIAGDVLRYTLLYEVSPSPTTRRSRLSQVTQCAGSGLCLPPINVTWDASGSSADSYAVGATFNGLASEVVDRNNDGLGDIGEFRNNGNGTFTPVSGTVMGNPFLQGGGGGAILASFTADMNGDGRPDSILVGSECQDTVNITYSCFHLGLAVAVGLNADGGVYSGSFSGARNGPNVNSSTRFLPPADFTGDGRPDFAFIEGNGRVQVYANSNGNAFAGGGNFGTVNNWGSALDVEVTDVNLDGMADLVIWRPGGVVDIYNSTGSSFVANPAAIVTSPATGVNKKWVGGDFNGDGRPDLAYIISGSGYLSMDVFLSNGTGFKTARWVGSNTSDHDKAQFLSYDANADGLTDIVMVTPNAAGTSNTIAVYKSTGDGFVPEIWMVATPTFSGAQFWMSGNIDSQGTGGLVQVVFPTTGPTFITTYVANIRTFDRVVSVGSLAGKVDIQYETLPKALGVRYFKELAPAFPAVAIVPPLAVVSGYQTTGYPHVTMSYGTLIDQFAGRGWLGFNWIQESNDSTGVVTKKYFRQDFPYTGLVDKVGLGTSAATWSNLKLTQNSYACMDFVSATGCTVTAGRRYFPYVKTVDEQAWDLNGALLPRTVTSRTLDSYGNLTTVAASKFMQDSGNAYTSSTVSTYLNDESNWRIGLLLSSTTTSYSPEANPQSASSSPILAIAPANGWTFGSVRNSVTVSQVVTVTNSGGAGTLTLSSSNNRFMIARNTCPPNGEAIAANTSCTVTVSFRGRGQCGGTAPQLTAVITAAESGGSTATTTVTARDWVYPPTDAFCR